MSKLAKILTVPNKYVERVPIYDDETLKGRVLYAVPTRYFSSPKTQFVGKITGISCLEITYPNGNCQKIPITRVKTYHKLDEQKQERLLWLFVPKK